MFVWAPIQLFVPYSTRKWHTVRIQRRLEATNARGIAISATWWHNHTGCHLRSPSTYICMPCALEVGVLGCLYVCRCRVCSMCILIPSMLLVSSPDLIRRVYCLQYNARENWKRSALGLVLGLGPRLVCCLPAMMPDLSAVWLPCQTPLCIWTPVVLLVTDQSARMLPGKTGQVITGTTAGTYRHQQLIYSVYTQCTFVQWGTLPDICMLDCLVQKDDLCMH